MTITKDELTVKAAAAEAPAGPSRVTVATAADLRDLTMDPQLEVPAWADSWRKDNAPALVKQVEAYLDGMKDQAKARANGAASLGEITSGTYVGLDVISFSPLQAINLPPYAPSRIIASGETAVIQAVVFINPAVDVLQGFASPATVQLGLRTIRIRFESLNLSTVANGPELTVQGLLPSPAPTLLFVAFPFTAPDPGQNPALIETNVTVDIVDVAQPWAAMATRHLSQDPDPGFLGLPAEPPNQLLNNIPNRFLVYSK
jgi:hypothetical protein